MTHGLDCEDGKEAEHDTKGDPDSRRSATNGHRENGERVQEHSSWIHAGPASPGFHRPCAHLFLKDLARFRQEKVTVTKFGEASEDDKLEFAHVIQIW